MKDKMNNENKKIGEQIISEIITKKIYSITIQGYDRKDYENGIIDISLWTDKKSQNILNKLFKIIQTELEYVSIFMGLEDSFSCTSRLLYVIFHKDYMNNKNLEKSIKDEIIRLEQFKFHNFRSKHNDDNHKNEMKEYLTTKDIENFFLNLRKRRIEVYKKLLDDFKENKKKYLDYMKKQDYTYF